MLREAGAKLIQQLSRTQIYQDYERALSGSTGLPLTLRPIDIWQPALKGKKRENPFCILMAQHSRSCAACLDVQHKLAQGPGSEAKTVRCFAGLCDSEIKRLDCAEVNLQRGYVEVKASRLRENVSP